MKSLTCLAFRELWIIQFACPPGCFGGRARGRLRAAFAYPEAGIRTNVYIDGFNLYYGARRKTPYRRVNLRTLYQLLLPKNSIAEIKYFTARVPRRGAVEVEENSDAAQWSGERNRARRAGLLADADKAAEAERVTDAGAMRAEARVIGAALAGRGDASMEDDAERLRLDMARVVRGEGPDIEKHWNAAVNGYAELTRLEEWSHAARYALVHYLPDDFRAELGMRVVRLRADDPAPKVREVADDWMHEESDWPEPEPDPSPAPVPVPEPQRGPERNGPDIEF